MMGSRALNTAAYLCLASMFAASAQATGRSVGTTSFVLEGNRVYALLTFDAPNGSAHTAYAYVDPGRTAMSLSGPLYDSLHAAAGAAVRFNVGDLVVSVPGSKIQRGGPVQSGQGPQLEAALPAWVLTPYVVVFDYGERKLTLAEPGAIQPSGTPVPF